MAEAVAKVELPKGPTGRPVTPWMVTAGLAFKACRVVTTPKEGVEAKVIEFYRRLADALDQIKDELAGAVPPELAGIVREHIEKAINELRGMTSALNAPEAQQGFAALEKFAGPGASKLFARLSCIRTLIHHVLQPLYVALYAKARNKEALAEVLTRLANVINAVAKEVYGQEPIDSEYIEKMREVILYYTPKTRRSRAKLEVPA